MKIIFFNNNKQVTNELRMIHNPMSYGFNEVMWDNGGYADITERYVIVDEEVIFEDVSDEEFLKQYKEQAKVEIAKQLERNRVFYIANGTLSEKEEMTATDITTIENIISEDELTLALEEILPKYKL
jgi:hypothetical protein